MYWISHPLVLENEWVKLIPLDSSHFDELLRIAHTPEIWTYMTVDGKDRSILLTELKSALLRRARGEEYAFTIVDNKTGNIIGSTRLYNMFPSHRKLEIGWTWYDPMYWGSGHNTACKLLLMTYCFETLKTIRVQYQVNEKNKRSRAAVEKIGATFEGVLRNDRIKPNGEIRNTAVYSVIENEWQEVKATLESRLKAIQAK